MKRREFIALACGVGAFSPFAARAQKAKPVIAILGSGAADASASKTQMSMLVASLARPGGNITGVATMAEDVQLKLFEIMREVLPGLRNVLVMTNPTNSSNQAMLDLLKGHAEKHGLAIDVVSVSAPADLDAAFAEMSRQPPGAVFVLTDNSLLALADTVIARALSLRIPTFGSFGPVFAQAGALLAYSRDPKEAMQGVARLLKKILDGTAPGELPFEQPTKFNLSINLKTAKALGIEITPTLL